MRALILTLGARGEGQPFSALARGLVDAGHTAVLAAPARFARLADGVEFAAIDDGTLGLGAAGGLWAKIALRTPAVERVLADCWAVARDADADVVVHDGQVIAGPHVAERLDRPAVLALPSPMFVPTRAFPWPGQAVPTWLPRAAYRATYLGMKGPAAVFARTVDRWRADLGLARRRGRHDPLRAPDGSAVPVLHAVSAHVLPRPADWPASATVTGYWTTPTRQSLPDALAAFLAAGPPPVFACMSGADPVATTATVLGAARVAGVRLVLGAGWGGLSAAASDDVFVVDEVPYEVLFPHVAAVVHHGDAGTVGAAAAAGRPQVVCPFVADQPFWGRRVHQLGVGTEPVDRLTAEGLAAAIGRAVTDTRLAAAAAALGERVRAEDGVGTAVRELERIAGA